MRLQLGPGSASLPSVVAGAAAFADQTFESQLPLAAALYLLYLSDVVLGSSAFSRCLREKGLNLLPHFSSVAAGALNRFFVVVADRHCQSETLATLFAKIFVKRHSNPALGVLWRRN